MKKKLLLFTIVTVGCACVIGLIYMKQINTYYAIYFLYGDKLEFMKATPAKRPVTSSSQIIGYKFSAYGISATLPFKSEPISENKTTHWIVYAIDEFLCAIYPSRFNDPMSYLHRAKIGLDIGTIGDLNNYLVMNFENGLEFVKSSFYSAPRLLSIFDSAENSELLLFQQTFKWHHALPSRASNHLYHYELNHRDIFQVGSPSEGEVVILWIYPDEATETEVHLIAGKGHLKQVDIDNIVSSISVE